MKMPIIVSERGDITIFDSTEAVEEYLEPQDVKNSEYEVFDSVGSQLHVEVQESPGRRLFGALGGTATVVKVTQPSEINFQEDKLRKLLASFLAKLNTIDAPASSRKLSELIEKVRRQIQ